MSDGEAAGWKIATVLFAILFLIGLFIYKPSNAIETVSECDNDTIVVTDTVYVRDTVAIWKQSKPDTVYITESDTI
jgi:uncharacterized membrane protein